MIKEVLVGILLRTLKDDNTYYETLSKATVVTNISEAERFGNAFFKTRDELTDLLETYVKEGSIR